VEPKLTVGQNIRRNRKRIGLTQEALAYRCDMHPVEVGRAERGTRDLRVSTVVKLARGLGHLFQVISRRYEHASIILTTNRGIADWGHIFEDTTVATAVLDRLLHHATVLSITGDSYRMRRHRDALQALRPALTGHPQGEESP
jgi:transcriptional regulator with XRE-family HTH domain